MFGETSADWVRDVGSVLATAWRLDPVLFGAVDADAVVTAEQVERIVRATSAVLRGDGSQVEGLTGDLAAVRDGLADLALFGAEVEKEIAAALQAAENVITRLGGTESPAHSSHPRSNSPADRGGIRPMEGVTPPADTGKGKGTDTGTEVWHSFERPAMRGFFGYDWYDVGETGTINLFNEDDLRLSPDSWVRSGDDFVHMATRMTLRGADGRIEATAERTYEELLDDDTLVPHVLWADESYVYLMPEAGGPVVGLPLSVAQPDNLSQGSDHRSDQGSDHPSDRGSDHPSDQGSDHSSDQGSDQSSDQGSSQSSGQSAAERAESASVVQSAYREWPGVTTAASVGRLEAALVEAGPGSISLVITPHTSGERLVAAHVDGQITWTDYDSGRPAVRPVATYWQSLDLGPDARLLHPTDALRRLDPGHSVFRVFQRIHASLTGFVGQAPGRASSVGPTTVTTPAPATASTSQGVRGAAAHLRGGFASDSESSSKGSVAQHIYQVLTGSRRDPGVTSPTESVSLDETFSLDEDRDWHKSSYSDEFCVEVGVTQDGSRPGTRSN
jgi:hypothetical protein